jgi:hypothetical protein
MTRRILPPGLASPALLAVALVAMLAACGGGGGQSAAPAPPPPPPPPPPLPQVTVSAASPFAANCDGGGSAGVLYMDAEVEPSAAVNPLSPSNVIAAWQQDRWSDGGSHGLVTAASFDAGHSWTRSVPTLSLCSGGSAANGADYQRASDPWLAFAADGTAYLLSLAFSGAQLASTSASAMLVVRSSDGGQTWGAPQTLIRDNGGVLNDKGAIGADALDAHYVYATWDRLLADGSGPTWFARTIDGGMSWEPARPIYDPGKGNQTLGNIPLSLADGTLLVVFTEYDTVPGGVTGTLRVIRSGDRGANWSAPVTIAQEQSTGVRDPYTGTIVRDGAGLPSIAADASGTVYVAWQSSAFSGGARDAIALARSSDGGATWSMPVRASGVLAAAAFTPNVQVRADGLIGVGYYDLRYDQPSTTAFEADYWLATSLDGTNFTDVHVSGPFPLDQAPNAEGLFLGDYQALASSGSEFLPVFVTSRNNPANRTDVYVAFW